ncbi:MAG: SAM-dependent methyltransferase, partial [Myxococcota bacterium]
ALPALTPRAWMRHDLIVERLRDLPSSASMLEVGVGQGAMGVRLARRFAWTGVEADATSAAVAKHRLEQDGAAHQLHQTHFEDAPLEPPYDVLVAFEVLEHIEDDLAALRQWYDLIAPGGRIVLSVPAWQDQFGPWDERVGHFRRYAPDELCQRLTEAGFELAETSLYGFPLGYILEAVRNVFARNRPQKPIVEATSQSGRLLQPDSRFAGAAAKALTAPFRVLHRMIEFRRLGTGLVASARRPA